MSLAHPAKAGVSAMALRWRRRWAPHWAWMASAIRS